eukprot:SAG11_NODE_959_length_6385_cov_30.010181_5_plen_264_part_00
MSVAEAESWLVAAVGLPEYAPNFAAHHIDGGCLADLSVRELRTELGIVSWGHRRRIHSAFWAAADAAQPPPPPAPRAPEPEPEPQVPLQPPTRFCAARPSPCPALPSPLSPLPPLSLPSPVSQGVRCSTRVQTAVLATEWAATEHDPPLRLARLRQALGWVLQAIDPGGTKLAIEMEEAMAKECEVRCEARHGWSRRHVLGLGMSASDAACAEREVRPPPPPPLRSLSLPPCPPLPPLPLRVCAVLCGCRRCWRRRGARATRR